MEYIFYILLFVSFSVHGHVTFLGGFFLSYNSLYIHVHMTRFPESNITCSEIIMGKQADLTKRLFEQEILPNWFTQIQVYTCADKVTLSQNADHRLQVCRL